MSFSLIRRAARGIRYLTVPALLGREITFSGRRAIVSEATAFIRESFPESSFRGPAQKYLDGQVAKYGLLELRFSVAEWRLKEGQSGVPILRELGFVGLDSDDEDYELDDDDMFTPMSGVEMVLDDLDEEQTHLKLLLRLTKDSPREKRERFQRIMQPELLEFPMTFAVTDACVTNVGSAWIMKHFYL